MVRGACLLLPFILIEKNIKSVGGEVVVTIEVIKAQVKKLDHISLVLAMELHQMLVAAVSFVGFISVLRPIHGFMKWVWASFLRPAKNLRDYGSWAVITGSTDGIGKALAFELASKGLNLVLVGRNPAKLELTSNEIARKHNNGVDIRTVVVDLAKSDDREISKAMEQGIEGLDIGILINNAGVAFPYPRFFHEVDSELMGSVWKVNIEGPTWVTRSVLPGMLKKKKGAIVNIGSGSSVVLSSYPLYSVYAATKAYLTVFSKSIYNEYKQHGIDVQCQIPLFVATKMTKLKRSIFIPSAETYSKASLRWVGYEHHCLPYWPHYLQWSMLQALPDSMVIQNVFNYFLRVRKKGLERDSMRRMVT